MQNQKEAVPTENDQNKQTKSKKKPALRDGKKKEGKIQQVWEMSQKGISVKDIAKKTVLKEQIVRSYIWRKRNSEKYKALLSRYQKKRKEKLVEKQQQTESNKEKDTGSEAKA
jgi:hypothetical protein